MSPILEKTEIFLDFPEKCSLIISKNVSGYFVWLVHPRTRSINCNNNRFFPILLNSALLIKQQSMSSHQRYSDIEWESLRVRINLYKQMKEQLLLQMKLYHTQRKEELAKLILESI